MGIPVSWRNLYARQEASLVQGFLGNSGDKESTCNADNPASIPGSGRSAGEETGYPLQYSWASVVVQIVKNLPAMQET